MTRKWLWTALLALPLAVAGGLVYANHHTTDGYTCPLTGEQLPCEKCCPLNQGEQAKQDNKQQTDEGYTCPLTGEQLPCPNCCPLNQQK
jgi:uncharacterized membrane protein